MKFVCDKQISVSIAIDLRNLSVRVIREIRVLKNKEFLLDSNICFYACQNVAHDEGNYSSGVAK